ncbi:MAG TPA: hypothetical protein VF147_06150 [Vicinamibacterales bacterium]
MLKHTITTIAALALASTITFAQQAEQAPQKPAEAAPPSRTAAQLVNVRIELAVAEQREDTAAPARIVTMVVADREYGRVRSAGVNAVLNVDARPEVTRDGRIKLALTMEYRREAEASEKTQPALLTQSLTAILEDGKSMLVSQSADPTAVRRGVRVEVKATISK